jgi:hypothetical protein
VQIYGNLKCRLVGKKSGVNITRLSITFAEYVFEKKNNKIKKNENLSPEPEPPTAANFRPKISYLKILPV